MSSKKILAASLAAVLATGSMAAVATADAPAAGMLDDAIVIGNVEKDPEYLYVAHVEGKVSGSALDDLLAPASKTVGNVTVTNGIGVDSTADAEKNGGEDNSVNPYNRLALGLWFNNSVEGRDSFKASNISMSVTVGGKTQKWKVDTSAGSATKDGAAKDAKTKTVSVKFNDVTVKDLETMLNAGITDGGNAILAKVLGPQAFRPEFSGLSETNVLESIDTSKSQITYAFDVQMTEADWKKFAEDLDITWDNSAASLDWTNLNFESLLAKAGTKIINKLCGVEGASYMPDGTTKAGALAATTDSATVTKWEKKNVNEGVFKEYGLNDNIYVNVGTNANLKQLKAINAGGTFTITLNQAIDPSKVVAIGTAMFYGTSGAIQLPLTGDYTVSDDNRSFVFELPAGLTWSEQLNQPNAFRVKYDIYLAEITGTTNSNPSTVQEAVKGPDGKAYAVESFVFKANGGASVDGGNSGNSGSQGGNTTNPGSTSGNPNTGIALAVAPIVLAAGAVVTIASKKRK